MRSYFAIPLLLLAACGGADSKALTSEGYTALGKGDAKAALSKFDAALEGMESTNADFLRASLGRCEALAKTDGAAAKKAFLDLASKMPTRVTEDDYGLICSRLLQSGYTLEAIDVMHAGSQHYPESPRMLATQQAVQAAAERDKTPDALEKLKSLGYAGGK